MKALPSPEISLCLGCPLVDKVSLPGGLRRAQVWSWQLLNCPEEGGTHSADALGDELQPQGLIVHRGSAWALKGMVTAPAGPAVKARVAVPGPTASTVLPTQHGAATRDIASAQEIAICPFFLTKKCFRSPQSLFSYLVNFLV